MKEIYEMNKITAIASQKLKCYQIEIASIRILQPVRFPTKPSTDLVKQGFLEKAQRQKKIFRKYKGNDFEFDMSNSLCSEFQTRLGLVERFNNGFK